MLEQHERNYLARREAEERAAARAATAKEARAVHLQMAYRYAALMRQWELDREAPDGPPPSNGHA